MDISKENATVLIIDDEEDILLTLKMLLKNHVPHIFTESNPYHLPRLLRQHSPDLVLLDMNFRKGDTSGEDGLTWLSKIKTLSPGTDVIIITAHGDIDIAVQALKDGAIDFVEKPWHNEKLRTTILSALKVSISRKKITSLEKTNQGLSAALNALGDELIGKSPRMLEVGKTIDKVAETDANVLILGENGTGKELAARAIHQKSKRSKEVFINVDLGAITESLLESELFGHLKGSFTDAHESRIGRFEAADQGTLFLDEIGNLSLPAQSKLLYAIQNRAVTPVGSNQAIPVDIRLVCATNMPLYEMISEHSFRQDLLYRMNTVEIHMPPLRERFGDIPLLVEHFLSSYRKKYQKPDIRISETAIQSLELHKWPGNIRELKQVIERGVILTDKNVLTEEDLSIERSAIYNGGTAAKSLNIEQMERTLVLRALQMHKGNITRASEELGLTRAALYRRLDKFGL